MNLLFKKVKTKTEQQEFLRMEYECSIQFRDFASAIGITDSDLEHYTLDNSRKYLLDPTYKKYIVYCDEFVVGMLEYRHTVSEFDGRKVLQLVVLFVDKQFRGHGIGTMMLDFVKKQARGKRVELTCYYDAPAMQFYDKLGLHKASVTYTF